MFSVKKTRLDWTGFGLDQTSPFTLALSHRLKNLIKGKHSSYLLLFLMFILSSIFFHISKFVFLCLEETLLQIGRHTITTGCYRGGIPFERQKQLREVLRRQRSKSFYPFLPLYFNNTFCSQAQYNIHTQFIFTFRVKGRPFHIYGAGNLYLMTLLPESFGTWKPPS